MTHTPEFGTCETPSSWTPDGEWIIFAATRSSPNGDIVMLSPFGREALWSRDGRDDVRQGEWSGFGADSANYDVAPDGSRFLMTRPKDPVTATVIDVVLNWPQTRLTDADRSR